MPQTGWFYPSIVEVEGDATYPISTWLDPESLIGPNPTKDQNTDTRTELILAPGMETNFLITRHFANVDVPIGAIVDGIRIDYVTYGVPQPGNVQNVEPVEFYLLVNNEIVGTNIVDFYPGGELKGGWDVGNGTDFIFNGVTYEDVKTSGFGVKLRLKNYNLNDSYRAYIQEVRLQLTYHMDTPHFYYNGSSESEVYVTLDKNPDVPNPTTTFSIFHGDMDTTSGGNPVTWRWGNIYTAPNPEDPSATFTQTSTTQSIDFGSYSPNYLSTDYITSVLELPYCCYNVTDHTMAYDHTDLEVGESYRRGLILENVRTTGGLDGGYLGEPYDVLYFNIDVIDTTPPPPEPPHFIYNGDTTSEVFVTLDLNPEVTNPTTTFSVFNGDDLTDGAAGWGWGLFYTPPQENDPDVHYSEFEDSPINGGVYDSNYLSTDIVTKPRGYGDKDITNHTMSYNLTGLVAGQTYRRGMIMCDFNVFSFTGDHIFNENYDILYFNIEVIDSSIVEETKKFKHTGTYNNFII